MWPIGSVVGRKTMVLLGPYGQQQLPTTTGFLKSLRYCWLAKEKPTKVKWEIAVKKQDTKSVLCMYLPKGDSMALGFYNCNRNETKQQSWIDNMPKLVVKSDNNHKGGVDHHHMMASPLETMSELTTMVKIRNVPWSSQNMMNLSQFIATVSEHSLRCGTKWKLLTSFIGVSPIQAKSQ